MTIEEAIEYFKERIEYCNRYKRKDLSDKYILAIEALEKQIAKKPTLVIDKSQNPPLYRCPCGIMSYYLEYEYCDECGQKLEWGEDK